jgi:hypothetical protein
MNRLIDEFYDGVAEKDWPAWAQEVIAILESKPIELSDDDLREFAYSAYEEAMSFGLSQETFLRYFKTIRNRSLGK